MRYKLFSLVLVSMLLISATCEKTVSEGEPGMYRDRMVSFVESIGEYARERDSDFIVIPQNGIQLLTVQYGSQPEQTRPNRQYLTAIDGIGRESVFYGYNADNEATPEEARSWINDYLQLARAYGKTVMVTDYTWEEHKMEDSYAISDSLGYISFAASHRELDIIPPYPERPHEVNEKDITSLDQAENFLYLLNTANFDTKSGYLDSLASTNYDLLIIDLFYHASRQLTAEDLQTLKTKANGGRRLVIAYMSIGEAEDYRYYWKRIWHKYPPSWMGSENPNWEGNYLVEYWEPDWQQYIYGRPDAYLDRILSVGFDGVYLDLVDAYRNFEQADGQPS